MDFHAAYKNLANKFNAISLLHYVNNGCTGSSFFTFHKYKIGPNDTGDHNFKNYLTKSKLPR